MSLMPSIFKSNIDKVSVSPHREESPCFCCSDGNEVVISAHRVQGTGPLPAPSNSSNSTGTAGICCRLFSCLIGRRNSEQRPSIQANTSKEAFELLPKKLEGKVGGELAQSIIDQVNELALTEAGRHKLAIALAERAKNPKSEPSADANASSPSQTEKPGPLNSSTGLTPPSLFVVGENPKHLFPFNEQQISRAIQRSTSANPDQLEEITKKITQEVTTRAPNGKVTKQVLYTVFVETIAQEVDNNTLTAIAPGSLLPKQATLPQLQTAAAARRSPSPPGISPSSFSNPGGSPKFVRVPSEEKVDN